MWLYLRLQHPVAAATFWLALYGMYVSSDGPVLTAPPGRRRW